MDDDLQSYLKKLPELMKKKEQDLERREAEIKKTEARLEEKYPNHGKESDVLNLNVGGTSICVLRRTLTQIEGSLLASMFSGRWDDNLEKDSAGNIFIDQDIELFKPLVNHLRALSSQTQLTQPPKPPKFGDELTRRNFETMLDYYGVTFGVFQFGLYTNGQDEPVAVYPDIEVTAEEKTSYWLAPMDTSHQRFVTAFEVRLGPFSTVQIGLVSKGSSSSLKNKNSGNEGVGYVSSSSAFDSSRCEVVINGSATPAPGISVKDGTVIRLETDVWKFDGEPKISHSDHSVEGTQKIGFNRLGLSWHPCLTIKGSFSVTNIELNFIYINALNLSMLVCLDRNYSFQLQFP